MYVLRLPGPARLYSTQKVKIVVAIVNLWDLFVRRDGMSKMEIATLKYWGVLVMDVQDPTKPKSVAAQLNMVCQYR